MDGQRFDDLTRFLSQSLNRKRFLTFVTGIVAPAVVADGLQDADAKKKNKRRRRGGGVGAQGNGGQCGDACTTDDDCTGCPNARCIFEITGASARTGPGAEGINGPQGVCASQCTDVCIGDCSTLGDDCSCVIIENGVVIEGCFCTEGCRCEGGCLGKKKKVECPDLPGCVCDAIQNECTFCPGDCIDNPQCREQGQDNCVCFLGIDTSSAELVAEVVAEGNGGGLCGECLGQGQSCDASTECCGQLVCGGGACRRKRKPKVRRCNKHGQGCKGDNDCCAQAVCYKGKCGEKDTHCRNDNECAQGYRCQGGPLAPGHRRCRKSGRHKRNKTDRKNG